ncbi:MAG: alpha/beta hydrolase [Proteobacteria bacterium]|nr:alpha/beta hydrolase [Pseudomonadota bacterium]
MRRFLISLFAACALAGPALAGAPAGDDSARQEGRPIVIGRSYTLDSRILGQTRRINVWLPDGYETSTKAYPVVVLLDGGEHEDFHHATGLFYVGAANGLLQDVIVVGIEGIDRRHDLTHPSSDPRDHKLVPTGGGSAKFRDFIGEELKPWIKARYRTTGPTALMGESLAGLFVVETFLTRPQMFDDYIAMSPSLWWDKQSLAKSAAERLKAGNYAGKSLYFAEAGDGGGLEAGTYLLADTLKAQAPKGLNWRFDPMPQEKHAGIYDPAAIKAIRWLFAAPVG